MSAISDFEWGTTYQISNVLGKHGSKFLIAESTPSTIEGYWHLMLARQNDMSVTKKPIDLDGIPIQFKAFGLDVSGFDWSPSKPLGFGRNDPERQYVDGKPIVKEVKKIQRKVKQKVEPERKRHVYFFHCQSTNLVKIGVAYDPVERLRTIQFMCPSELKLLATKRGGLKLESELHEKFKHHRSHGEWFHADQCIMDFISKEATPWTCER